MEAGSVNTLTQLSRIFLVIRLIVPHPINLPSLENIGSVGHPRCKRKEHFDPQLELAECQNMQIDSGTTSYKVKSYRMEAVLIELEKLKKVFHGAKSDDKGWLIPCVSGEFCRK